MIEDTDLTVLKNILEETNYKVNNPAHSKQKQAIILAGASLVMID